MRGVIDLMYRYPVTSAFLLGCASVALFTTVFALQDLEEELEGAEETPAEEAKAEVKHGRRAARRA